MSDKEILEQLVVLAANREADADAGRVVSHEEIKRRIDANTGT